MHKSRLGTIVLLGEPGDIVTWMVAALVAAVVAIGRTAPVAHRTARA